MVTSLDLAGDNFILISGHNKGSLGFWDLKEYKLLKFLPNIHQTDVTNVKILSVANYGSNVTCISCEDSGPVKFTSISKKAIFGGYNFMSEYLFLKKMKVTTCISM